MRRVLLLLFELPLEMRDLLGLLRVATCGGRHLRLVVLTHVAHLHVVPLLLLLLLLLLQLLHFLLLLQLVLQLLPRLLVLLLASRRGSSFLQGSLGGGGGDTRSLRNFAAQCGDFVARGREVGKRASQLVISGGD